MILKVKFRGSGEKPGCGGPLSWMATLPFAFDRMNIAVANLVDEPRRLGRSDVLTLPSGETVPDPISVWEFPVSGMPGKSEKCPLVSPFKAMKCRVNAPALSTSMPL